jgi:hypothetical protein
MKRFFTLLPLLLLLSISAHAGSGTGTPVFFTELQALSRAQPVSDPQSTALGVKLIAGTGYRLSICAGDGVSLLTGGSVQGYVYPLFAAWPSGQWAAGATWTIPLGNCFGGANCTCEILDERVVAASNDFYFLPAAVSVTTSSATNVRIFLETWSSK